MSDHPGGGHVRVIRSSDISRCPKMSLLVEHYRDDGSCRCSELAQALHARAVALMRVEEAEASLAAAKVDYEAARQRVREC